MGEISVLVNYPFKEYVLDNKLGRHYFKQICMVLVSNLLIFYKSGCRLHGYMQRMVSCA